MKIKPWQMKQRQGLPLDMKIEYSKSRIRAWHNYWEGDVYVAFSGGKDSTVLLDLVRNVYPDIPAVFNDTGLEYPEIKEFVKTIDNVTILKPKMNFKQVLDKYGYPVISKMVAKQIFGLQNPTEKNKATRKLYLEGVKRDGTKANRFKLPAKWHFLIDAPFKISPHCCEVLKKSPAKLYERKSGRKPFIGTMASDSNSRRLLYLERGCNWVGGRRPISAPISFWLERDIWQYLKGNSIPYSSIYDMGYTRTGCMFCVFGTHLDSEPNKFQRMKQTHPKIWDYCINKLGIGEILNFIGVVYD